MKNYKGMNQDELHDSLKESNEEHKIKFDADVKKVINGFKKTDAKMLKNFINAKMQIGVIGAVIILSPSTVVYMLFKAFCFVIIATIWVTIKIQEIALK